MSGRSRFQVRVTYATGVVHTETEGDDFSEVDAYARTAVQDYCPRAEVVALCQKGVATGQVLSVWDPRRLRRWEKGQKLAQERKCHV